MPDASKECLDLTRALIGVEEIERRFTGQDTGWAAEPGASLLPAAERLLCRCQHTGDADQSIRLLRRQVAEFASVRQRLSRHDDLINFRERQPAAIEDKLHRADGQALTDEFNHVHAGRRLPADDGGAADQVERAHWRGHDSLRGYMHDICGRFARGVKAPLSTSD
jgi:hypothetical protein